MDREIISQRDPGDENDYKEIAMNELLKQIEQSEEQVKQATNLNRMVPLILRNQLAIMKLLTSRLAFNPEPSLGAAWPIEPIEIPKYHVEPLGAWPTEIPLRPETRTIEEGR